MCRQGLPELFLNRLQQSWVRMLVSYALSPRNPTIHGSPVNIAMDELPNEQMRAHSYEWPALKRIKTIKFNYY